MFAPNLVTHNLKHLGGNSGQSARDYDGTNDFGRITPLVGAADGKKGTVSVWFRIDGGDGNRLRLYTASGSDRFTIQREPDDILTIEAANDSGSTVLKLRTTTTVVAGASWRHLMASWDLATAGARHLYLDGVSNLSVSTFTNDNIDYTRDTDTVGASSLDTQHWNGALSELYINEAQYVDLSSAINRGKFRVGAYPAFLGSNGSKPTGTQPIIYMPDGNPAANKGSGGNFTITGALDTIRGPA